MFEEQHGSGDFFFPNSNRNGTTVRKIIGPKGGQVAKEFLKEDKEVAEKLSEIFAAAVSMAKPGSGLNPSAFLDRT